MSRRIIVRTSRPAPRGHEAPEASASREVQALDPREQARLVQEALAECETALEELERLRLEWLAYQEQDQPAYVAWLHSLFGPLIQEIRDAVAAIGRKRRVIEAVERIAHEHDCGYAEAYAIHLEEAVEGDDEGEAEGEPGDEEDPEAAESGKESSSEGAGRGHSSQRSGRRERESAEGLRERVRDGRAESSGELKSLYRALARKLHPDVSGLPAEDRKRAAQLWFQVQEAYESGDADRLKALAAVIDAQGLSGQADGRTASGEARDGLRLSEIRGAARKYRKAARDLQRNLDQARRTDPAFGFLRAKKNKTLKKQMRRELEAELAEAQAALESLERFIEDWEHEAARIRFARNRRGAGAQASNGRGRGRGQGQGQGHGRAANRTAKRRR